MLIQIHALPKSVSNIHELVSKLAIFRNIFRILDLVLSFFFILSFLILPYSPQHSHLYYIHFVHMLLLNWPTFCFIGHSWTNCYPIKISFNIVGMRRSKSTPEASLHFNHPPFIPISINLYILANINIF
eukprot:TRINITY_DN10113_c2_g1_i2.p1 TRINITY_DN10113_c2_g1~~TRINITY_DN10113_c2_g1_i2.p1  ORF type:complete len:129 (+),score=0.07 TRINITY_DN10113_c2_g1_i2:284-670(+)